MLRGWSGGALLVGLGGSGSTGLTWLAPAVAGPHDWWQARRRANWQVLLRHRAPHRAGARMPGQCRSSCRARHQRPCRCHEDDPIPARLFVCVRCRAQVAICSRCDRGHIYCAADCARRARDDAQRAAARRYQVSLRGRLLHAARARRYRARQKNVTHHGSPPVAVNDLLRSGSVTATSDAVSGDDEPRQRVWRCHWCGCRCPPLIRQGFLRRHGLRRGRVRRYGA